MEKGEDDGVVQSEGPLSRVINHGDICDRIRVTQC